MNGVMSASDSAGSSHRAAVETLSARVIWPSGAALAGTAASTASAARRTRSDVKRLRGRRLIGTYGNGPERCGCTSGVQRRPVVDVLEAQRPAEQPLLERAPDRPLHGVAHGAEAEGVWIVAEDGGLFFEVLP